MACDARSSKGSQREPASEAALLRFLIDTNVFISSEPSRLGDVETAAAASMALARAASGTHQLLVHPTVREEIANDADEGRRALRDLARGRYPELESPPAIPRDLEEALGKPADGTHDWYDHQLLACVTRNAVHGLITQDTAIHRKARRLGVADRVYTLADAVAMLERLAAQPVVFIPSVDDRPLHSINVDDPFFDSLKADYPPFERWFSDGARSGRRAWVVNGPSGSIAGLCILKGLDDAIGVGSSPGKVSTLKVADEFKGSRYGELLLKTVFLAAHQRHDVIWLTVFEKHAALIALLKTFGFEKHDEDNGEHRYVKRFVPEIGTADSLGSLDSHIRYGPPHLKVVPDQTFIVPIRPEFHISLFPDAPGQQQTLAGPRPHGNALRKAYLCRANLRAAEPGATLLFYRSVDEHALTAAGTLEATLVSRDPTEIVQFVGSRTVYSTEEITVMARAGEVLTLLFRQDRFFKPFRSIRELQENGVVKRAPQTMIHVPREGIQWVKQVLDA